jgi:hypothetical protein
MDHLVKVLSYLDVASHTVKFYILDVDQISPSTMDDFKAATNSLKKVGCCGKDTDSFKIRSSTTDSGGAMTKGGFGTLHKENKLATPDMIVGMCDIHNTQLQLSNPVLQLLAAGELGKRNLMQLLHTVYAL